MAQIVNLRYRGLIIRCPAGCQPAIQQDAILRYNIGKLPPNQITRLLFSIRVLAGFSLASANMNGCSFNPGKSGE